MAATIFYDGDCPFCTHYVRHLRLRDAIGHVELVDLRRVPDARHDLEGRGFDIDKGMVLDLNGDLHAGDEAVHRLALMSTGSSGFNRLNRILLGSRTGSALLYPLLRLGRNVTLLLLGRQPMTDDNAGERAWQTLFGMAWGLFAYLHVLVYAFQFGAHMHATTWLIAPLGLALVFQPRSRRLFLVLLLVMLVDAWRQAPSSSNHTILKNAFLLALLLSGTWHMLRGSNWWHFLRDAAPVGRAALVCMYIFGVFHKINRDFLDPQVSCAVVLWRDMPRALRWIDFPAFHQAAIYGTLVIETVILVCLLSRRGRHTGIIFGIGFHSLLAMSGYAIYAPFSTLTIALHLLFLDRDSARGIVESTFWQSLMRRLHSPAGAAVLFGWALVLAALAWNQSYSSIGVLWLPVIALLCHAIWKHGNSIPDTGAFQMLGSRLWWLNIVSILFFFNCITPYLGLKTAQSMNMFANLHLEEGRSNHLVFANPPGPFGYLADVVTVRASTGSPRLLAVQHEDVRLTYYALLDHLDRNPSATVDFERDGRELHDQDAASLAGEIERTLHPRWIRAWFHFNPVDLRNPKPCSLNR